MTWATPVKIEPDEMWCVWHDMWSGHFEFICGSDRAAELLAGGMTKINGRRCRLEVVGEWPSLGALQIRATTPMERAEPKYAWQEEKAA